LIDESDFLTADAFELKPNPVSVTLVPVASGWSTGPER